MNRRDEAEHLRVVVDNLPAMSVAYDEHLRCVFANKGFAEFFGLTPEAILGRHLREVIGEDPYLEVRHHFDRVLDGHSTHYERIRILEDGSRRHLEVDLIPHRAPDGRCKGLFAITADVTQRKQAEAKLRASEEKFSKAFHSSPDWVVLSGLHSGKFLEVNEGFERISGFSRVESVGRSALELGIWSRPEQRAWLVEALLGGAAVRDAEVLFRRKSGEERVIQVSMETLEIGGEPCLLTVGRDITERRREQQLRDLGYAVTELIAGADSSAAAVQAVIRAICVAERWDCGRYFQPASRGAGYRVTDGWGVEDASIQAFLEHSRRYAYPSGGSTIDAVWTSGRASWITDTATLPGDLGPECPADLAAGGAFVFPVRSDGEVIGVLVFNSRERRTEDEAFLRSILSIGGQIGQFLHRKHAEERAHYLAHFDELTGLPNRATFTERLTQGLARARRAGGRLAVLFIDLDRFKSVNDSLGHGAGDEVLKVVAGRMRRCLREPDTVSRLGGDEFLVLVEDASTPRVITGLAQRLLDELARPVQVGRQDFHLSASIGISTYPSDGDDPQAMVQHADIAMYRAKELGKNNYQFYSAELNVHTLERVALESDLRRALDRHELTLHYQPRIDVDGMRIVGMEALVRWQHPQRGRVPPLDFIPLAEETGLIVRIGEWVLREACRQTRAWQDQGLSSLRVAVNLSGRQFARDSLLDDVVRVLDETGLAPGCLELEITESMVMGDPERAVDVLRGLKAKGVHLSIDDFGTGYSSLAHLKRFPLDSLKIDQSFIQGLPDDADDAEITRAIIAMAHSLRLQVVAEGVESAQHLAFLRENGCDQMQGYYFSKPLPARSFRELASEGASDGVAPTPLALPGPRAVLAPAVSPPG